MQAFDFLRADDGARVLLDILDTEVPYIHLCHPNPVLEIEFIDYFSTNLGLRVVHIDDWMASLQREHDLALADAKRVAPDDAVSQRVLMKRHYKINPASRIISFFRNEQDSARGKPFKRKGVTTVWSPLMATTVAMKESKTMQDLTDRPLGEKDVERWLRKWREIGFLEDRKKIKANL